MIGLLLIANAISATDVNCNFQGTPGQQYYQCVPDNMDAITSQNQPISIIQNHLSGGSNNFVNYLRFSSPSLSINYIPTKIFESFQNLEVFFAYDVQLQTLSTNAFINCLKLNELSIFNNPLTTIDASFAEGCTNLISLFIYNNPIQSIHKDAFKGLSKVEYLNLQTSNITKLDPATFKDTVSVKYLSLYNNLLTEVNVDAFATMKKLEHIDLNLNRIKVLPALDLTNTPSLQGIYMYGNRIEAIDPNFLPNSFPGSTTRA